MAQKFDNLFSQLNHFERQIEGLEEKILQLEQKLEAMMSLERNHLIRIKNKEELTDDYIYNSRKYHDLSPEKAWKLYCNRDFNYILIDVSSADYKPLRKIPEAIHMPWEDFQERFIEIASKTTPLLIMCEDGTNSVLACEFLVRRGFFNCNNVSGGYKYWKGFGLKEVESA